MHCMGQSGLEARGGADSISRAIGGRVRQGRGSRGWTLDQLAERSGVSRRMLVSIEQAVLVAGTEPPDVTELWDWTLGPGESHSSEAHTAGTRELLFVLDGQLELRVGQHAEVLATGDSASFAGDLAHEYVNASSAQVARFALTVFEPTAGGGAAR